MEDMGFEPMASRMQSKRSTTELNPQHILFLKCGCVFTKMFYPRGCRNRKGQRTVVSFKELSREYKAAFTRQRTASFPFSVPHLFFRFRAFTRSKLIRGGLGLYRFRESTREQRIRQSSSYAKCCRGSTNHTQGRGVRRSPPGVVPMPTDEPTFHTIEVLFFVSTEFLHILLRLGEINIHKLLDDAIAMHF